MMRSAKPPAAGAGGTSLPSSMAVEEESLCLRLRAVAEEAAAAVEQRSSGRPACIRGGPVGGGLEGGSKIGEEAEQQAG